MTVYEPPSNASAAVSVEELIRGIELELEVRVVAGHEGLQRRITHPRIQKSGLALVGHLHGIVPTRIQILGETELSYLHTLSEDAQCEVARVLFSLELACLVITRGVTPPQPLVDEAEKTGTPLICCKERSSVAITALHTLLDEYLAPRCQIHGVLVDVFEVGVLIVGASGIGKSECALELVMKGHRLIADDIIECEYRPPGVVFGHSAQRARHHMEVRGLGILNIKDLYGVTAIRGRKRIHLIVQLELWRGDGTYDRLGIDDHHKDVLGVSLRMVLIPVQPGRNMSSIIEIAARNELLRQAGHHPAQDFISSLEAKLTDSKSKKP